tara:strand:- start:6867 stop:7013 length:147 start_codon:yes stop_codon:yes gene_type:complete
MKVKKKNKKVDSKLFKKQFEENLKKKLKEQGINEEWMKNHLIIDTLAD